MVTYLSQQWLDRQRELLADLPEQPGLTVRVQQVVTGGPDGDVTYHLAYESGRLADAGLGEDADAEVVLTSPRDVAAAIATGELEAGVAFMQGRLKTEGPTARLTPLLALMQSPPYRDALHRLGAETTDG
jgi:hypothetical protein